MKKNKSKFEKFKMTILVIFLFIVCVGSIELAICYWHDPHVFTKIVTPVQDAAKSSISNGKKLIVSTGNWLTTQKQWFDNKLKQLGEKLTQPQKAKKDQNEQKAENSSDVLTRINGVETLTGGTIPLTYFAQNDPEWKDQLYGNDPIGVYGCGPTSLAMVVNSLGVDSTNPAIMSAFCAEQGYWAPESGSYHSIVQGVSAAFGITCSAPQALDTNEIITRLLNGEIAIALMGPGHFTDTGHFIVLRGVTKDNKLLVADPISRTRSLQEWDAQLIVDELSMSRSSGAPLWFLSVTK